MAFITGLLRGTSNTLRSQSAMMNRQAEGIAADRRFGDQMMAEESRFSRTLAQSKAEHESLDAYRRESLRESTRQYDKSHEQRVLEHRDKTALERDRERGLNTRFDKAQRGIQSRWEGDDARSREQFTSAQKQARDIFDIENKRANTQHQDRMTMIRAEFQENKRKFGIEFAEKKRYNDEMIANQQRANNIAMARIQSNERESLLDRSSRERMHSETIDLGYARIGADTGQSFSNLDTNIVSGLKASASNAVAQMRKNVVGKTVWGTGWSMVNKYPSKNDLQLTFKEYGKTIAPFIAGMDNVDQVARYVRQYYTAMLQDKENGEWLRKKISNSARYTGKEYGDKQGYADFQNEILQSIMTGVLEELRIPFRKPGDAIPDSMVPTEVDVMDTGSQEGWLGRSMTSSRALIDARNARRGR